MGKLPTVKEIMTHKVFTLKPTNSISKAVELLNKHKISGAPVVDDEGKLIGILGQRDCLSWLVNLGYYQEIEGNVSDFMTEEVATIHQDADLFAAAAYFVANHYRRLPVMNENDEMVGIVSRLDVMIKGVELSFDRVIEAPDPGYLPREIKARLGQNGVRHIRKHKS